VPHFAISIALKSNNEIVSGLIYDPIKDEMFYAEKNNGAYFNNKRIRVSKRKKMEDCLFASGEIDNENIKQKTNAKLSIRKSGSAALDMAYVASGRYDGYFQKNLNLWDIAAGIIIVKEAGGQVNDLNLKQNNNIDITASSSSINEQLLKNLINF
jgi:myo-inositol-1(or 4)-monophosphatase